MGRAASVHRAPPRLPDAISLGRSHHCCASCQHWYSTVLVGKCLSLPAVSAGYYAAGDIIPGDSFGLFARATVEGVRMATESPRKYQPPKRRFSHYSTVNKPTLSGRLRLQHSCSPVKERIKRTAVSSANGSITLTLRSYRTQPNVWAQLSNGVQPAL